MSNYKRFLNTIIISSIVFLLQSCTSSGPATSFYSLFAHPSPEKVSFNNKGTTIGIAPVTLPEYLDNPSVISLTETQRVKILGYHAWAGSFKESINRVLADDISNILNLDAVWSFPWDNRIRPDYQIRIVFDELAGKQGDKVRLKAKWTVLNKKGNTAVLVGSKNIEQATNSKSADDYVAAINRTLNELSLSIAKQLAARLSES
ncbi:PqiC family protein [Agarilytica rhodophyticola]|uniref:PqiC family protein n=1 Tax=Agarilytica rhodophyticola TaxID=1737490 RepID=UPI000B345E4A|nr:PqiC family protein [Agarilytica rhodophyticola]